MGQYDTQFHAPNGTPILYPGRRLNRQEWHAVDTAVGRLTFALVETQFEQRQELVRWDSGLDPIVRARDWHLQPGPDVFTAPSTLKRATLAQYLVAVEAYLAQLSEAARHEALSRTGPYNVNEPHLTMLPWLDELEDMGNFRRLAAGRVGWLNGDRFDLRVSNLTSRAGEGMRRHTHLVRWDSSDGVWKIYRRLQTSDIVYMTSTLTAEEALIAYADAETRLFGLDQDGYAIPSAQERERRSHRPRLDDAPDGGDAAFWSVAHLLPKEIVDQVIAGPSEEQRAERERARMTSTVESVSILDRQACQICGGELSGGNVIAPGGFLGRYCRACEAYTPVDGPRWDGSPERVSGDSPPRQEDLPEGFYLHEDFPFVRAHRPADSSAAPVAGAPVISSAATVAVDADEYAAYLAWKQGQEQSS